MNELLFYNLFVKKIMAFLKAIHDGSITIDNSLTEPDFENHTYSADYILNIISAEYDVFCNFIRKEKLE